MGRVGVGFLTRVLALFVMFFTTYASADDVFTLRCRVTETEKSTREARAKADALAKGAPPAPLAAALPAGQEEMILGMVERLAGRLKDNPDDAEGWRMLARSYEVLGETDKAKEARAKAEALSRKQGR